MIVSFLTRSLATATALVLGTTSVLAEQPRVHRISTGAAVQSGRVISGALREGQTATHDVWLPSGTTSRISGTCDGDCLDLDLELWDGAGYFIARDFLDDDVPLVSVRPRYSDRFRVEVTMAHCSVNPCRYTIVVD